MLIEVKPLTLNRFILRTGPYLCFYCYEENLTNMKLVGEILELEKQFPIIYVLKMYWLEHKNYFNFKKREDFNRVVVHSSGEMIANCFLPNSKELINLFKMCKNIHDYNIKKQNQEYVRKEMILKNFQTDHLKPKKKNQSKIKCFKNKDEYNEFYKSHYQKFFNVKLNYLSDVDIHTSENNPIENKYFQDKLNSKIKFLHAQKILKKYSQKSSISKSSLRKKNVNNSNLCGSQRNIRSIFEKLSKYNKVNFH